MEQNEWRYTVVLETFVWAYVNNIHMILSGFCEAKLTRNPVE